MALTQTPPQDLLSLVDEIRSQILQLPDVLRRGDSVDGKEPQSAGKRDLEGKTEFAYIEITRQQLIGKLNHLTRLLYHPSDFLIELTQGRSLDLGTVRAIVRLNIAPAVPLDSDIAVEELSVKVSVEESTLARLLAYAETLGLFRFTTAEKNRVAHTIFSAGLVNGFYADIVEWDVTIPPFACVRLFESLEKYKNCVGPERAPFKFGLDTEDNFYQWHHNNPRYEKFFHLGMESEKNDPRTAPHNIVKAYPWGNLAGKTVVDVGGSTGHVAKMILQSHADINFVIQDLPDTISNLEVPEGGSLLFVAHDFFKPQPLVADAYFLRYIFHNWTDSDCIRILNALRPALRSGAKLLVAELVQESHKISPDTWFEDRLLRRRDMQMMTYVGAHERTVEDYNKLVRSSVPELRFDGCNKPAGSLLGILEWTYI